MERRIRISAMTGIEETTDNVQYEDWTDDECISWFFHKINTTTDIIYAKVSVLTYKILNEEYGITAL